MAASTEDLKKKLDAFKKLVEDNKTNTPPPEAVKQAFLELCEAAASLDGTFKASTATNITEKIKHALNHIDLLKKNSVELEGIKVNLDHINKIFKNEKLILIGINEEQWHTFATNKISSINDKIKSGTINLTAAPPMAMKKAAAAQQYDGFETSLNKFEEIVGNKKNHATLFNEGGALYNAFRDLCIAVVKDAAITLPNGDELPIEGHTDPKYFLGHITDSQAAHTGNPTLTARHGQLVKIEELFIEANAKVNQSSLANDFKAVGTAIFGMLTGSAPAEQQPKENAPALKGQVDKLNECIAILRGEKPGVDEGRSQDGEETDTDEEQLQDGEDDDEELGSQVGEYDDAALHDEDGLLEVPTSTTELEARFAALMRDSSSLGKTSTHDDLVARFAKLHEPVEEETVPLEAAGANQQDFLDRLGKIPGYKPSTTNAKPGTFGKTMHKSSSGSLASASEVIVSTSAATPSPTGTPLLERIKSHFDTDTSSLQKADFTYKDKLAITNKTTGKQTATLTEPKPETLNIKITDVTNIAGQQEIYDKVKQVMGDTLKFTIKATNKTKAEEAMVAIKDKYGDKVEINFQPPSGDPVQLQKAAPEVAAAKTTDPKLPPGGEIELTAAASKHRSSSI